MWSQEFKYSVTEFLYVAPLKWAPTGKKGASLAMSLAKFCVINKSYLAVT